MEMKIENKILEKIEKEKPEIVKMLEDLVKIPTQNPPGENYEEFVMLAKDYLDEKGIRTKVIRVPDSFAKDFIENPQEYPRFLLLAELKKGSPTIHFNGHYDVVPAGDGWMFNPFSGKIMEGKLYGRGASDMKGGIASIIATLRILSEFDEYLNVGINASFVPDEETTSMGTKYLIKENLVAADYAIITEPTSLKSIDIGCKGGIWMQINVKGKAAHASRPWLGENAFEKGTLLAHALLTELKPKVTARVSKYEFHDPDSKRATMELGGYVRGGNKINVIPEEFCFSIDRRVLPDENIEDAYNEIVDFIDRKSKEWGILYEIMVEDIERPYVLQGGEYILNALSEITKNITGTKPKAGVKTGFTEMALFGAKGVKALTFGPGDENLAHIVNEYIELKQLVDSVRIFIKFLLSF
ncbi:M20 family metallopeptidase [Thermococcus sp. 2319x1]|uniref:M20 family metallopeptidase n=1 Tax=Thermococcus sp. 2319x1 TaxID=1674923 RepID=UPI00158330BA|nr:M20 family metallopeptidase [Thermococcus sp. 2319x1]